MGTYISQFPLGNAILVGLLTGGVISIAIWKLRKGAVGLPRALAAIAAFGYFVTLYAIFLSLPIDPLACSVDREPILLSAIIQKDLFHTIKTTGAASSLLMIGVFVPLPVALYAIVRSIRRVSILSFVIACLIEPAQLLIDYVTRVPRYVVDIDDAFLMIVGVTIGLAGLLSVRWTRRSGRQCDRIISDVKDF